MSNQYIRFAENIVFDYLLLGCVVAVGLWFNYQAITMKDEDRGHIRS